MIPRNAVLYKQNPDDPMGENVLMTREECHAFWAEHDEAHRKRAAEVAKEKPKKKD